MKKVPPFKLTMLPLSNEAASLPKFKWADAEVGTRHRLGGEPDFLQQSDIPCCPSCNEKMSFYAQLDSINDDLCIGDCGMIYVYVCFECVETKSIIQLY